MRGFLKTIAASALALMPLSAFAIVNTGLATFMQNVTRLVIQPIILLLFALAMFYFVSGIATYIRKSADPKEREKGAQHMLWGIVGLFIMASAVLIVNLLARSFNVAVPSGF